MDAAIEHPFAQYIRILGKGPNLSRPLTQSEAFEAFSMILQDQVEPLQLGAFLTLLRVKTETPAEMAGMVAAIRKYLKAPVDLINVDVDWGSYAGKSRQYPLYLLAALALAGGGVSIFMHGAENHTAGRLYTSQALTALGLKAASSWCEVGCQLKAQNFAYMTLPVMNKKLGELMALKQLLGLRTPVHSLGRMLNPLAASLSVHGVTHPPYLPVHQEAGALLNDQCTITFKGDGGEAERRPEKPCDVWVASQGQCYREEFPPLISGIRDKQESLDPTRLRSMWHGDIAASDEAAITGTMALVLRYSGRANSVEEADVLGKKMWAARDLTRFCP